MADRTSVYKFLYLQNGDKWYPGFDYENMLTAENQYQGLFKIVQPGILSGWTVEKLSDNRTDQLTLLSGYIADSSSEYGTKLSNLNLNFSITCAAGTTQNISLSGGAPSYVDGVTLQANDKILVKSQTTSSQNGVYEVTSLGTGSNGTWTRSSLLDAAGDFNSNFLVYVSSGVANTSTLWLGASLGNTFGTNSIYFIDAFSQCAKVYPGTGIVDIFTAKTEKPYYFRYQKVNDYYVWADSTASLTYNQICKISSPSLPDTNYGTKNKSTYLATVVSSLGSTLHSQPLISNIIYDERRNSPADSTSSFQQSLKQNFISHKHIGTIDNSDKVLLKNDLILSAQPIYASNTATKPTVFYLVDEDGNDFIDSLDAYGIPVVYVNNTILSSNDYNLVSTSSPYKLYLKNSVEDNAVIKVVLSLSLQKELFPIDSLGNKISGTALTSTNYVFLSDGQTSDRNPNDNVTEYKYNNFSWSEAFYNEPKLYVDNSLVDSKYYTLGPGSAKLTFKNSFPNLHNYTYDQVKLIIEETGREYQNLLNSGSIEYFNAEAFSKNQVTSEQIANYNHSYFFRYKNAAKFLPSKQLVSGFGNTIFYPENTSSDLQFNTDTNFIFKTLNNGDRNILVGSVRGLMDAASDITSIKSISSWNNDLGKPKRIFDNIIQDDNTNYFNQVYVLTEQGSVFYKSTTQSNWNTLKLPYNSEDQLVFVNAFDISTDKVEVDTGVYEYSSFLYLGTNDGVYFAKINENDSEDEWEWTLITDILVSGSSISSLKNINFIKEVSTKNVEIVPNSSDIITYDRTLYVGSNDDTYPGLYAGDYNNLERITSSSVSGIQWIKTGTNNLEKNNILWWDDYNVYITHSAKYIENSNGSYWLVPFTDSSNSYTNVVAATTANITLSGSQTIDSYSVTNGDRVLVKNQTTASENGIYVCNGSGAWSRATDFDNSSEYENYKKVNVTSGNVNIGSTWYLKAVDSFTLDTDAVNWDFYILKVYETSTPSYTATRSVVSDVIVRNSDFTTTQYIVGHTDGLAVVTEASTPTVTNLSWAAPYQGSIKSLYSTKSTSANGLLYAATNRGVYVNTELLWADLTAITDTSLVKYPWKRTENMIYATDTIKVFDAKSVNEISIKDTNSFESLSSISSEKIDSTTTTQLTEISNITIYEQYQILQTASAPTVGQSLIYEREYKNFYIDPWDQNIIDADGNAIENRVIVYINDVPTKVPYLSNASTGLIQFVSDIEPANYNKVRVTIAADTQYLSNIGNNSHDEKFLPSKKSESIAVLSLAQNADSNIIYLNQDISSNAKILLLESGSTREIVYVNIVNNYKNPVEVVLDFTRSSSGSTFTFPAGTLVYEIKDTLSQNIQDKLYNIISKSKYNLSSLNNANTLQLELNLKAGISTVFDVNPSAPFSQVDTRGLKNTLLVKNFATDSQLDPDISEINEKISLLPSTLDSVRDVHNVLAVENLSKLSTNTLVGTDNGLWKYNGVRWTRIEDAGNKNVNSIYSKFDGTYVACTDDGLYTLDSSFAVSKSSIFTQKIYEYLNVAWGNKILEAYAKEDGLSLVISESDFSSFTSDYVSDLDNIPVRSVFVDKGYRIESLLQTEYDLLFALSDNGIYAVSSGNPTSVFNTNISSRKVLDNPTGVTKIFKAIKPEILPTIPANQKESNKLFILTDDGILLVKNWRWCDPTYSSGVVFNVDERFLRGTQCYSAATSISASPDGIKPGKSKIFIGTNKGVYRSFDEGTTFEPTQRIHNKLLSIYDLKVFESVVGGTTYNVLVAATNEGLWYTIDDGDNWYKTGSSTDSSITPILCDYFPSNNIPISDTTSGSYLAQTFITKNASTVIDKVSVLLKVRNDNVDDTNYQSSLTSNTIQVLLCNLDVNDKPNLSSVLATSTTSGLTPNDLIEGEFTNFQFNYSATSNKKIALVVREIVTGSNISVLSWKKSNLSNPYSGGKAFTYYSSTWAALDGSDNYDYFFKVHYSDLESATETIVPVGSYNGENNWRLGKSKGIMWNDSGTLTCMPFMLVSLVIDDTLSMQKSYDQVNYETYIKSLIDYISDRTTKTVGLDSVEFSAYNLWFISNYINQKTQDGFLKSKNEIKAYIDDLRRDGSSSELYKALDISAVGMNKASVNDMSEIQNDETTSSLNAQGIIDYLSSISSLGLEDIKADYLAKSNQQVVLQLQDGYSTGTTTYVSVDGVNRFTWSTSDYAYAEVIKNGTILTVTTDYTISPSLGRIIFTSSITASDIVEINLREDWDGTENTLADSPKAREYMLDRFSNAYVPVTIVVTDGENISSNNISDIIRTSQVYWDNLGYQVIVFGTSGSDLQAKLAPLCVQSGGNYFQVESASDWSNAITSLLQNNTNNIFKGYWTREFNYSEKKYIKYVFTNFSYASAQNSNPVKFRYSQDYINYTDWINLPDNTQYVLEKFITNIEYKVEVEDSYLLSVFAPTTVSELYHVEVTPAEKYYFSDLISTEGYLNEYILSDNSNSYTDAILEWGICRGNSSDWNKYEKIVTNRNSLLSRRQKTSSSTDEIVYENLVMTAVDSSYLVYYVYKDNEIFTWTENSTVSVYSNGTIVPETEYRFDYNTGIIRFDIARLESEIFTANITELRTRYVNFGESTTTTDNKTYYLVNGPWTFDADIVVYVNNTIIRNSYVFDIENGSVTFNYYLSPSDIVTVYIQFSDTFRIGLKVLDYDTSISKTYDFALQYTLLKNLNKYSEYLSTSQPLLSENRVLLKSSLNNINSDLSINYPIYVSYNFKSLQNTPEGSSNIRWFRTRSGTTLQVTSLNGLTNYDNRVIQKQSDTEGLSSLFIAGDEIYVEIEPNDTFKSGVTYTSEIYTLYDILKPYVSDVQIKTTSTILNNQVTSGIDLTAYYSFTDPESGTDQSIVRWYDWTSGSSVFVYEGAVLPYSYLSYGKALSFIVTPFNGTNYGIPQESNIVNVI